MTPDQLAYIDARRRQIRYWPWMAALLLALIAGFFGWLWQTAPINIDPMRVLDQFRVRTLPEEELILLAARGSLALVTCGLLLVLVLVLITLALWNEKKLIRILDEVRGRPEASGLPPAVESGATAGSAKAPAEAAPGLDADQTGSGPDRIG